MLSVCQTALLCRLRKHTLHPPPPQTAVFSIPQVVQLTKSGDSSLKREAVEVLRWLLAFDKDNQSAAAAAGAIPQLVQLIQSIHADLQIAAVTALRWLVARNNINQSAAAAAGAIPSLLHCSKSSDVSLQRAAVEALNELVANHEDNKCAAAAAGAIPQVVQLTKSSDLSLQMAAVEALGCLVARNAESVRAIPELVQLTKSTDASLQRAAVTALRYLVVGPNYFSLAGTADTVEAMCILLSTSPESEVAQAALVTLNHFTSSADNCRTAVSLGAVELLTHLKGSKGDRFDEFIGKVLANLARLIPQSVTKTSDSSPSSATLYANRSYHCDFRHCVFVTFCACTLVISTRMFVKSISSRSSPSSAPSNPSVCFVTTFPKSPLATPTSTSPALKMPSVPSITSTTT